jgi:carboxyl-terminal processing protease
MQKIIHFMMRRKGWILLFSLVFAGTFIAFRTINRPSSVPIAQKQKLLVAIGQLLEEQHYSPKKINDEFSKQVFKKYFETLDNDKTLFLQTDIDVLKKFETQLDDEIHGGVDIQFVPALSALYDKRIPEITKLYKEILNNPFDFTTDETLSQDVEKMSFSANETERKDRWRKRLKYLTLERYADLLDQRDKSKIDSIAKKTNTDLEKEARAKVLKLMDRTYDRIKVKFNEDERFNSYVNVISNLMDPHTDYFPPVEKRAFDEQMSGRFYGIGAQLKEEDGVIKIAAVMPGGPAFKSGEFMMNDAIVKVGQGGSTELVDVTGYAVEDAVKLIRGNKNTEVKLTIRKNDGSYKTISLMRDEIVQDETFARSVIVNEGNKKIGYISLLEFYADFERPNGARCSEDVAKEIIKLKAEKVDGIVIDLRFNGGGSLYEVAQMVGLFIKTGPVVQIKDRQGKNTLLEDKDPSVLYDGPLAVMVNETSASASEIFAAAIQDYKRGVIIGSSSTYGKGTVQRTVPFGKPLDFFSGRTEFGALKLTFQKFYRVNGGSTQLRGVTPDIILPDPYDYFKIREKDNPASLPWDEVAKAPIQTYEGYETVIKVANEKLQKNQKLNIIKNNTQWLGKNSESAIQLKLEKYKEQQKILRNTLNQNNALLKLDDEMDMQVLPTDKDKFYHNADKAKGERYQNWLKNQKTDMYIDESVKILANMIAEKNNVAAN